MARRFVLLILAGATLPAGTAASPFVPPAPPQDRRDRIGVIGVGSLSVLLLPHLPRPPRRRHRRAPAPAGGDPLVEISPGETDPPGRRQTGRVAHRPEGASEFHASGGARGNAPALKAGSRGDVGTRRGAGPARRHRRQLGRPPCTPERRGTHEETKRRRGGGAGLGSGFVSFTRARPPTAGAGRTRRHEETETRRDGGADWIGVRLRFFHESPPAHRRRGAHTKARRHEETGGGGAGVHSE